MDHDEQGVRWLVGTPASDVNFQHALKAASLETLIEAISRLEGKPYTKSKLRQLRSRMRRLEKEARPSS